MDGSHLITIEGASAAARRSFAVSDVLAYLTRGISADEIIRDLPELTSEDICACRAFAADRGRRLVGLPTA